MAADECLLGEQLLETLIGSNPKYDENLHLARYKLVKVQNNFDKEKKIKYVVNVRTKTWKRCTTC